MSKDATAQASVARDLPHIPFVPNPFGLHGSLGLPSKHVVLVPYDERWPDLYAAEIARIVASDPRLRSIRFEHMGSTAIPGLCAKPIIDILAGYPARDPVSSIIEAFIGAEYVHRGESGIPGRQFFRRGDPRMYHLHLAAIDGKFWWDHLRFRDLLRNDASLRDAYASLKTELVARYPRDRESYIDAKGPFVRDVLARH